MSKKVLKGFVDVFPDEVFWQEETGPSIRYSFDADVFPTEDNFGAFYDGLMADGKLTKADYPMMLAVTITIETDD